MYIDGVSYSVNSKNGRLEETEEIDWKTLEKTFISDSELACLDVS